MEREQGAEEIIQILFKYKEGIEECFSRQIYHNFNDQFCLMHVK